MKYEEPNMNVIKLIPREVFMVESTGQGEGTNPWEPVEPDPDF